MIPRAAVTITDVPRESARVRTVAKILEADESQVRRLVDEGTLESHVIGKRGVRIYLDSVADYQKSRTRAAKNQAAPEPSGPPAKKRQAPASRAAHRAAIALLQHYRVL